MGRSLKKKVDHFFKDFLVLKKMKDVYKGYLMCFTGVFSWSFSEIMVKMLQGSVGPISLSFWRFFISGLFLLFIMFLQRDYNGFITILKRYKWLMILSSIIALGISNMIYFIGLQFTPANIGAACYSTYPIFISIYSIFLLNERSNLKLKMVGFALGLIGTTILITEFQFDLLIHPVHLIGNSLIVIAAAIWAFYSVLGKKIFNKASDIKNIEIKYTTLSSFLACIPIMIVLIFTPDEINTFFIYSWDQWIIILILGIIATGFGLFIFFKGVKRIEVSKGISLALFKPIIAIIFSFVILFEVPNLALFVSLPLIIIAVLLINRPIKNSK